VPTDTNLRGQYATFAELVAACQQWCEHINARVHRETGAAPLDRLAVERAHLHVLPADPHTAGLGEERLVNEDQTVRVGSVRYSTPPGHVGTRVWCRTVYRAKTPYMAVTWHYEDRVKLPGGTR
jgi:hypothetical protein